MDLYNSPITIFKVNVWFRKSNPDAYTPMMVSIGPYHKKNPQLNSMEKYKLLYLRRFLQRKECLDVKNCISELEELKEEALKCYEEFGDDGQFCQMLLLDGCFVIEFIRECSGIYPEEEIKIIDINESYIFRDLMLLENQLPFFVLNKLYQMTKKDEDKSLKIVLVNYFCKYSFDGIPEMSYASLRETESNSEKIKHLLHVVHIFSCHGIPMKKSNDEITWHEVIPNATELSEAGVRFARANNSRTNLFDIKFKNGLMTIPCFRIENNTETFLRNLISYEQQSSDEEHKYFSDYAVFMNYLIDSDKDVALICKKRIIEKWFAGDDKEVVNLFKNLVEQVTVYYSTFFYKTEFREANKYCLKTWNRIRATIIRNFFKKAWTGTSTVAGIIIFILTIIQTILAFVSTMKKSP